MPSSPEIRSSEADLYIAVDLGAGSGRVFLAGPQPGNLFFEEISRFQYPPREHAGHLRWDFSRIFTEIKAGLKKAGARAAELGLPIRSIGVDSWAVDYGLIDDTGKLLADPVCYRDDRTLGAMERVFAQIPRSAIFEKTGIQFLNFNTIYQLYTEAAEIENAKQMLLLPDLINFFLTGKAAAEYTNATTTQLVNASLRDWDRELIGRLDLPDRLFPDIIQAGTNLGPLKLEIAEETGLTDVCVIATATHDTASAIAGAPLERDWAYISSGTWSLIGVERDDVLINGDVARHNFTNEGGVFSTIRFLKNVMGLWIFESCRKEWMAKGIDAKYEVILGGITAIDDFPGLIFPDDERFLNPPSMLAAIETQLRENGQKFNDDPITISKVIFDSLAFRYASILKTIQVVTDRRLNGVQIVGGGGRNEYLNQMTADASGLNVQAGLVEATAMGNVLVQAIAAGRFSSLSEGREYVRNNMELKEYSPQASDKIIGTSQRYAEIEAKFVGERAVL
jgi:rhamnulokinase